MATTSDKKSTINIQGVLNALGNTLEASKHTKNKNLKKNILKIQRTHYIIQQLADNKSLDDQTKVDAVGAIVLASYQRELADAKASDSHEFNKKLNSRNDHLHYGRMLALILKDISSTISNTDLIKRIKSRHVETVLHPLDNQFYNTAAVEKTIKKPSKETKPVKIVREKAATTVKKTAAPKRPIHKEKASVGLFKTAAQHKPKVAGKTKSATTGKSIKAAKETTKSRLKR